MNRLKPIYPTYEACYPIAKKLAKEGKRIGKNPWCCDGWIEKLARDLLFIEGIAGQETMEETKTRRAIENRFITKEQVKDIMEI